MFHTIHIQNTLCINQGCAYMRYGSVEVDLTPHIYGLQLSAWGSGDRLFLMEEERVSIMSEITDEDLFGFPGTLFLRQTERGYHRRGIGVSRPFHAGKYEEVVYALVLSINVVVQGEIICEVVSKLSVLDTGVQLCSNCAGSISQNERVTCQRCNALYCSSACQWQHRTPHSLECKLSTLALTHKDIKTVLTSEEKLVCLMALLYKHDLKFAQQLDMLTSHEDEIGRDSNSISEVVANMVKNPGLLIKFDKSVLERLACIIMVNATTMQDSRKGAIGLMFDPMFSLINHSCDPNIAIVFSGRSMTLLAQRDIPSGAELSVTYCYLAMPTALRRYGLQSRFFFKCNCSVCKQKVDRFYSCNCPNCHIQVYGFDFETGALITVKPNSHRVCQNCGTEFSTSANVVKNVIDRCLAFEAELVEAEMKRAENERVTGTSSSLSPSRTPPSPTVFDVQLEVVTGAHSITTHESFLECLKLLNLANSTGMIPLYHYPLRVMYDQLVEYHDNTIGCNKIDSLRFYLVSLFGSDCAEDVSPLKLGVSRLFITFGCVIDAVSEFVEDDINNTLDCYRAYFTTESRNILRQAALVCFIQAYLYQSRGFQRGFAAKERAMVISQIEHRRRAMLAMTETNARDWINEGLCHSKMMISLKKLCILVDAGVDLCGNLAHADRRHQPICLKCDRDMLKELVFHACSPGMESRVNSEYTRLCRSHAHLTKTRNLFPPTHPLRDEHVSDIV